MLPRGLHGRRRSAPDTPLSTPHRKRAKTQHATPDLPPSSPSKFIPLSKILIVAGVRCVLCQSLADRARADWRDNLIISSVFHIWYSRASNQHPKSHIYPHTSSSSRIAHTPPVPPLKQMGLKPQQQPSIYTPAARLSAPHAMHNSGLASRPYGVSPLHSYIGLPLAISPRIGAAHAARPRHTRRTQHKHTANMDPVHSPIWHTTHSHHIRII